MASPESDSTRGEAPWESKRNPAGRQWVRRSVPWAIGGVMLGLIAWGLWPKPVVVETGVVARGALTVRVSEEGKTRVRNRYVVAAPVAGRMRRVSFRPGDEVKAGETVLTAIEPVAAPLLDARARAQAEAVVAAREAARNQAAQSLEALRASAELAEAELSRVKSVARDGTLSQSDRERAQMEFSMRSAEVRAAEFSLKVSDYEWVQAKAALERPEAGNEGNLVEVTSPVSGRVLRVMQESEMVVTPGVAILEVGDPTDLEIEAEILSRDAVTIQAGDAVEVDQWGGEAPLKGRVRRVEPAAFTKISALGVEEQRVIVLSDLVDAPESARALGDRYRVEVRVAVWHSDDALIVPAGALFREGNAWKTYVMSGGVARLTGVEAGRSDGRFTQVVGGVKEGAAVLLHPPDTVKDGTAVQVGGE